MKEYKVTNWKGGLTNNNQRLEDFLNEHAREGWILQDIEKSSMRIIFERDKNR